MNYQEFQRLFHTLPRNSMEYKLLCDQYPQYRKASMAAAWAAIDRIRARKKDKEINTTIS